MTASPTPAATIQTHRVPEAVIQRAMATYAPPPAITTVDVAHAAVVQRAAEEEAPQSGAAQMDLDAIAREVYPILRRMLEVDRERRTRF